MFGFHHLRRRVRVSRGLEVFPSKNIWRKYLDYLMYGAGIIAPIALIPQILQIYTSKSAEGLSLPTWILLTIFNILWVIYGAVHKDKHIMFASILMAIFNSIVVVGILLY